MALTECEYCNKKIGNLVQHFRECSKAQRAFAKDKVAPPKRSSITVAEPTKKIVYLKRGPKAKVDSCSLCDNGHYAHGLCKQCYMRAYMRNKRSMNSYSK